MAGSDGFRSRVLSSAEQVFERCRGDGGRNLIVPLEEVLVAGDDVVGLVLSCQRNELVIVGVSSCSNDRDRVVDEVGNSSNGRQVELRELWLDALSKPRPTQHFFDLGKYSRADHDVEIGCVQPSADEPVRRSSLDHCRNEDIRVEDDSHWDSSV